MTGFEYLKITMNQLSNIVYNATQGSVTKDEILDSLINKIQDYNNCVDEASRISIEDFRK